MTEQELEAISARAAAATPGPWLMEYADGADSIDLFGSEPIVFVTTPDDDAEFCIGKVHYVTHQTQHDGQFIADARTDVPALVAALREAQSTIARVAAIHRPYGIYEECGHDHEPDEPGVTEVDDVGLVCAEGKMYDICGSCCAHDFEGGQDAECAENHAHAKGEAICDTFAALHAASVKSDGA